MEVYKKVSSIPSSFINSIGSTCQVKVNLKSNSALRQDKREGNLYLFNFLLFRYCELHTYDIVEELYMVFVSDPNRTTGKL